MENPSDELIEKVAKAIYNYEGGLDPDEWEVATGCERKDWKTDAPWDTNPDELCEWQRDEYRTQARAVLKVLNEALKVSRYCQEHAPRL